MLVRRCAVAALLFPLAAATSGCGSRAGDVPDTTLPGTPVLRGVLPGTLVPVSRAAQANRPTTPDERCRRVPARPIFEADREPSAVTVCVNPVRPVTVRLEHRDEWAFGQPEVRGDAVTVAVSETETADLQLVLSAVRPGVVTVRAPVASSSPAGGARTWEITVRSVPAPTPRPTP